MKCPQISFENQKTEVVGIDISKQMIDYARAQAKTQGLDNARFEIMNALKLLAFADNTFDLVNARLLVDVMSAVVWPTFMQECVRITRPGSIVRLSETDAGGVSNGLASETLSGKLSVALKKNGQGFSPDLLSGGITPMLGRLLQQAGCEDIKHTSHAIDYSAGTEAHMAFYRNLMVPYQLLEPFLLKIGVTTKEEFDELYQQMLVETLLDDFRGL